MTNSEQVNLSHRSNSYDFVRFIAAMMVLYSHHFPLAGFQEPLVPFYSERFGELAVYIFFSMSGFLIYRSLDKNNDWWRFFSARFLRVMPNLTAALVLTSAVTLVYFQNYANIGHHVTYVLRNMFLVIFGATYQLPGVFDFMAMPALNGPLWSLQYELHLYFILFLIVTFAGRYRIWVFALALPLLVYPWITETHRYLAGVDIFEYSRLGQMFLSGALLGYLWKYWQSYAVPIGIAAVVAGLAINAILPFNSFLDAIAVAAATIGLGSSRIMSWFSRGGDGSYGMYIYAWPIQQFAIMYIGNFWLSMFVAAITTIAVGYTTWHLFEKRCMRHVDLLANTLRPIGNWLIGSHHSVTK